MNDKKDSKASNPKTEKEVYLEAVKKVCLTSKALVEASPENQMKEETAYFNALKDAHIKKKAFSRKDREEFFETLGDSVNSNKVAKKTNKHEAYLEALEAKRKELERMKEPGQFFHFYSLQISLPSPDRIKEWTTVDIRSAEPENPTNDPEIQKQMILRTEVKNARTFDYKTLEPELGGLFCQNVFGPLDRPERRRHQLGYINLWGPVVHLWYLKGTPSYCSILLNQKRRKLEKLTYQLGWFSGRVTSFSHPYTNTNLLPLLINRHNDVHFSDSLKKIWLNHSVGLRSLTNCLFDSYLQTYFVSNSKQHLSLKSSLFQTKKNSEFQKLSQIENAQKQKEGNLLETEQFESNSFFNTNGRMAWEQVSTDHTINSFVPLNFFVLPSSWTWFLKETKQSSKNDLHNAYSIWQKKQFQQNNKKVQKIDSMFNNLPRYFPSLFFVPDPVIVKKRRKKQQVKSIDYMFHHSIVFNTVNLGVKVKAKDSVFLIQSCPLKFDQLFQQKVESNYSSLLKAFFNSLWNEEKLDQRNNNQKQKKKKVLNNEFYKKRLVYKKHLLLSTFKQGLIDNPIRQLNNDQRFFHNVNFVIQSQLLFALGFVKPKEKKRKRFWFNVLKGNSGLLATNALSLGFRFSQTFMDRFILTFVNNPKSPKNVIQPYQFIPISLKTNIFEVDKYNQTTKCLLLPFIRRNGSIFQSEISLKWYQIIIQRKNGRFSSKTKKKRVNPLGQTLFRQFIQKMFLILIKKNLLLCLIKKSKLVLLSQSFRTNDSFFYNQKNQWVCFSFNKRFVQQQEKKKIKMLNNMKQMDYEKQKIIYLFLRNFALFQFDSNLSLNELLSKKHQQLPVSFVQFDRHQRRKVNEANYTLLRKPPFLFFSNCFKRLQKQPFCSFFLNPSSGNRKFLNPFNPFLIQNQNFYIRYLKCPTPLIANLSFFYDFNQKKEKAKLNQWLKVKKSSVAKKIKLKLKQEAILTKQKLMVAQRKEKLELFLKKEHFYIRNNYAVIPLFFFWDDDGDWKDFLSYMSPNVSSEDKIIPAYVERTILFEQLRTGPRIIERALRNLKEYQIDLLNTEPETEKNRSRVKQNEPFLFSNDPKRFFHDRLIDGPKRTTPPLLYAETEQETSTLMLQWFLHAMPIYNHIIYFNESLLRGREIYKQRPIYKNLYKRNYDYSEYLKFDEDDDRPVPFHYPDITEQDIPIVKNAFRKPFYYPKSVKELRKTKKLRFQAIRRYKVIRPFFRLPEIEPKWMVLNVLPVLPPDLRPILVLDSQQIVVSDLNQLYQQIIYRNQRIYELIHKYSPGAMEFDLRYSERLLQEAVDALIENGKGNAAPTLASNDRPLKSLGEMLKGKKGRFRQNLLGKRVDYSGRSVIVVGPQLKIYQCGLPKEMAVELFQPFLIRYLLEKKLTRHFLSAKRLINSKKPIVWESLREVMKNRPILLNRAPTLHRLGMQAFQPLLVSGRAILLHPLVCNAYNADFDGDQMAVHIPIAYEACAEAWKLMWSRNNILSPATGEPVVIPSQDMILGCYYLTTMDNIYRIQQLKQNELSKVKNKSLLSSPFPFSHIDQILYLVAMQKLQYHSIVWLKWNNHFELDQKNQRCIEIQMDSYGNTIKIYPDYKVYSNAQQKKSIYFIKTTPGRALINQSLFNVLN